MPPPSHAAAGRAPLGSATLLLVPTELERARILDRGELAPGLAQVECCGFGPVAAAARTAALCTLLRPARVVLVGIAGAYDVARHPVGSASEFAAVAIDGVGAGRGAGFLPPRELGFPQWPGGTGAAARGVDPIYDRLPLAVPAGVAAAPLLLTTCAASASAEEAAERRARFPEAAAEDMEGFAVATRLRAGRRGAARRARHLEPGRRARPARWRIPAALAAARARGARDPRLAGGVVTAVERLRIGISTCPNDTFAFHGALERRGARARRRARVRARRRRGAQPRACWPARSTWPRRASTRRCTCASAAPCSRPARRWASASGRSCWLRTPRARSGPPRRVLCPGAWTTATLLYRLFHPGEGQLEQVVFSSIVPELEAGRADCGVCIHEARFTYAARGLCLRRGPGRAPGSARRAPAAARGHPRRARASARTLLARISGAIARSIDCARAAPRRRRSRPCGARAGAGGRGPLGARRALRVRGDARPLGAGPRGAGHAGRARGGRGARARGSAALEVLG